MTIALALKAKRAELGITQRMAADQIGTSQENVNRWEKGTIPKGEHLEGLFKWLGATPAEAAILLLYARLAQAPEALKKAGKWLGRA